VPRDIVGLKDSKWISIIKMKMDPFSGIKIIPILMQTQE